jgi:hypothetical protein
MNTALFERLLYEEETATLDFKKEQYLFVKASDDEKSELLKDILGFANSFRRTDAYILIGVEDVRGGRSNVVGIAESAQLQDHSLQQFVNNLTNRPIRFHYEAFTFNGMQVGVIKIEQQSGPFYLKRDFGKLRKTEVYVRRGSSTDPSKPALPDEIAQMGFVATPEVAQLVVEFAELSSDASLGPTCQLEAEFCEMPAKSEIPLLRDPTLGVFVIPTVDGHTNKQYFRELAHFEFVRRLFRPIRVVVKNSGSVAANMVRCEIEHPVGNGVVIIDSSDRPRVPKRRSSFYDALPVGGIRLNPQLRNPGDVSIDEDENRYRIEIDCSDMQPGRRVWSEKLYIGIRESGEVSLRGKIFAANLPSPQEFTLQIRAEVTQVKMSFAELKKISIDESIEDAE